MCYARLLLVSSLLFKTNPFSTSTFASPRFVFTLTFYYNTPGTPDTKGTSAWNPSPRSIYHAEDARLGGGVVDFGLLRGHRLRPCHRLKRHRLVLPLDPPHLVAVEETRLGLLGDPV